MKLTEREYFESIKKLSKLVPLDCDYIVGILRGGALVALLLSYFLDKPVIIIKPGESVNLPDRHLLVVDDIYDSGRTMTTTLSNIIAKKVTTAVLITKQPQKTPIYVLYVPLGVWVDFWYDSDKDTISSVKKEDYKGGVHEDV